MTGQEPPTLGDLPMIGFSENRDGWVTCYRCGSAVPDESRDFGDAQETHERWHEAIEGLQAVFTISVDGQVHEITEKTLADAIVSQLTTPREFTAKVDDVMKAEPNTVGAFIRDQLANPRPGLDWSHSKPYTGPPVNLTDAQLVDVARRERVAELAKQNRDLIIQLQHKEDLISELRTQVASADAAIKSWRFEVQDALGAERRTPWSSLLHKIREQMDELTRFRNTTKAEGVTAERPARHERPWSTDDVNARLREQVEAFAALLNLASRGRKQYADGAPEDQGQRLEIEAETFRNAALLVRDSTRIRSFIPTSMLPEAGKLTSNERMADVSSVGQPPGSEKLDLSPDAAARLAALPSFSIEINGVYGPPTEQEISERAAALAGDADELCPSLCLYNGALLWCGKTVPHDEHHYHYFSPDESVRWTNQQAVPVPWPRIVEPPQGVDLLIDTGVDDPERYAQYLHRVGSNAWFWADTTTPPTHKTGALWPAAAEQAHGDLHVAHPQLATAPPVTVKTEPCPSLFLSAGGELVACMLGKTDGRPALHQGMIDSRPVRWHEDNAVPVPWPLDQEPPAGIDTLHDIGEDRPAHRAYLRRVGNDGWVWWPHPSSPVVRGGAGWAPPPWSKVAGQVRGDLHVVRP